MKPSSMPLPFTHIVHLEFHMLLRAQSGRFASRHMSLTPGESFLGRERRSDERTPERDSWKEPLKVWSQSVGRCETSAPLSLSWEIRRG